MSFTNGFNNGFGLVNGVMQQNRNNERQAMLDERNEERYREGLALQRERAEQAQSNADRSFGLQETQFKLGRQDVQWNQDNAMLDREDEADQREFDNNIKLKGATLAEQKARRDIELNKLQTMEARNNLAQQYITQYANTGYMDDEMKAVLSSSVHAGTFNRLSKIKSDVVSVMDDYSKIQSPDELLQFINQPKTLKVVNETMRQELYMREKATGNDYEIIALEPAPGGVIPIFKITDKSGKVVTERAPATSGQSSGKDENVMVVSAKAFKEKIVNAFRFVDYAESDPILKSVFEPKSDSKNIVSTKHGLYNKQTKQFEYKSNDARTEYLQKSLSSIDQRLKEQYLPDEEKADLLRQRSQVIQEWNALTSDGKPEPKAPPKPEGDDPLGMR